jgi:predicted amidohydrolase
MQLLPTDPPLGVAVCYDIEFPACAETLTESGCLALAVPAFTETMRGFQRVRWCAQARATERQVFVLHASLVGSLNREPVPTTYGSSAILTPSVLPFPETAILAETPMNQEAVAVADLDWESLLAARESDDVRNWHDRHRGDYRLITD